MVPPTVVVTTQYPGASAQTVSDTVAAPIEQQINGVEDMLYLYSQATSNGQLTITVTFRSPSAPISTRPRCWFRTGSRSRNRSCQ